MDRSAMTAAMEREYLTALERAIDAGFRLLSGGSSSLDAVEAAVMSLEDCPLFNAGKGSVFTHDGKHEMDASIMEGNSLNAGAVAGVQGIKNPVHLARMVMEIGRAHV